MGNKLDDRGYNRAQFAAPTLNAIFIQRASAMPTSKQETQRQCILHLWNQGIRNGQEIHRRTNIPLSTIYDNIKKKATWIMHAVTVGHEK